MRRYKKKGKKERRKRERQENDKLEITNEK